MKINIIKISLFKASHKPASLDTAPFAKKISSQAPKHDCYVRNCILFLVYKPELYYRIKLVSIFSSVSGISIPCFFPSAMPNIHFPTALFPPILSEYKPFVLLDSATYLLLFGTVFSENLHAERVPQNLKQLCQIFRFPLLRFTRPRIIHRDPLSVFVYF